MAFPTTQPLVTSPFPPHPDPAAAASTGLRNRQLLSTISSASSVDQLKQIHAHILRLGVDHSNSLLSKLALSSLDYAISPSLHYAISVFGQIPNPNPRITNRFLRDLSRSNQPLKTLSVYGILRRKGLTLDRFSFPPLLKASSKSLTFKIGIEIHGLSVKLGFDGDPFVQTALVAMYAACGRILVARSVFDRMSHRDVVTWSTMIDGYCQSALFGDALALYEDIKCSNIEPDGMILSSILSACGRSGNLTCGKEIHEFITMNNMIDDHHLQSALITMYSNCGSMEDAQNVYQQLKKKNIVVSTAMISGYSKLGKVEAARSIFNQIEVKDLVCWSAMISGYAESNQPQEALGLFKEMQKSGTVPDQVTMLSVISACANLGALDVAKSIHIHVDRSGFGAALPINNALIDMYAKCGDLERAITVFNRMGRKNVISWTTTINSFAIHGDASNALNLFHQMKAEGYIQPNGATFVSVLYACSHAGLVEEGRRIFALMKDEHKIIPKHEHYGCMVDLFGRSKLIREALEVVEMMPLPPNVVIWGSLMAACRVHGELELGEFAAKRVLELEPNHDGAHVFLSNVYAKEKRWEDVGQLRMLMKNKGILKDRAVSRIELRNEIHEFLMADRNHKQAKEIYAKLDEVVAELKLVGYTPNACDVLVDVDEEEKVEMVLRHSEKLALCYGLIGGTKGGSCIRIVKNLRICEDCHTFMKYVSNVYRMNIIVRDRTRFHHYKNGSCSCKDHW
ncbi:pentatricopeptide repeat-containing protein At4g14820 [Impatiens glandulifera]|uniref:pentatricopeptide repeat-containing protein At4g14820 n=1 Tax=Impatiens glandulifera TaxID=253017 RepID=UPI001FB18FAF|nr:pentatricopeptide repeat-containing protein At4g14820 [Impatiens glandulifera]